MKKEEGDGLECAMSLYWKDIKGIFNHSGMLNDISTSVLLANRCTPVGWIASQSSLGSLLFVFCWKIEETSWMEYLDIKNSGAIKNP